MKVDYAELWADPSVDTLMGVIELRNRGLNPAQINILRMLKSKESPPTDRSINRAVEALVHVILGNYSGSEYGDCIEAREGLAQREETIEFINEALQELR